MTRTALTYRITTLGCRVNHAETRELESVLAGYGLSRATRGAAADIEVVHTCSVTGAAAAKSRHAVRRAGRRQAAVDADPGRLTEVLVTGCWATTDHEDAVALARTPSDVLRHEPDQGEGSDPHGLTLVERFERRIGDLVSGSAARRTFSPTPGASAPCRTVASDDAASERAARSDLIPLPPGPATIGSTGPLGAAHTRAELRIQDGCDAHCTFCIIPRIRRTLRSKGVRDAVEEARRLVESGHREIVLSGIFIGAYGHETALRRRQINRNAHPLADLVDAVAHVPGLARLRISSMEPGDVDGVLLDAMVANAPVVVPHLHLPLQSGSDRILRRMNRQYRVGAYLEMIDQVNEALTRDGLPPAITTDIICGFPGETEDDFARTRRVAERVGYLHMHVFPFSPRAGTAAARWRDQFVPVEVRKRRVRDLIDLETHPEHGLSLRYRRRLHGRRVRVILEQPDRTDPGLATGRCDHYALIHAPTRLPRGRVVEIDVTDVTPHRTVGRIADARVSLPVLNLAS